jgi:nucleotide-binding universal stress UspA family protein
MKTLTIKKILIPVDFSATSLKALDYAVMLAKLTNAEITLLHVIENIGVTTDMVFAAIPKSEAYDNKLIKISDNNLAEYADKMKRKGVTNVKTISVIGRTHREVIRLSKKLRVGMIVMGTHGVSGFREFVVGSNTHRVVSDAQCPVLSVQRKNSAAAFQNIVLPFNEALNSREKVIPAVRIALLTGATIHVLGIGTDDANTVLPQAKQTQEIIEGYGVKCTMKVFSGPYTKGVLEHSAKVNADLIVEMGDLEKQNIAEYFTGSYSQQLINHSPIPVLSIHSRPELYQTDFWHGLE